jgi:predicted naringenin-chalcone synthase
MTPSILALATAVPPHAFEQNEVVEKMIDILNFEGTKAEDLRKLYQNSAIKTRHSTLPDFQKERNEWHFWGPEYPKEIPGMSERNAVYKKDAVELASQASAKAIRQWGGDPKSITHIISVSCTGVIAPGIEFLLIPLLGLDWSVNRLAINFMGCFGAFKGLLVAGAFAKECADNRILVVCTELCSLHLQTEPKPDNILAASIFSDGSGAFIVGCEPKKNEEAIWSIERQRCMGMDKTLNKMTWEAGNSGFTMTLSPQVPALIGRNIAPFIEELLGSDTTAADCDWAIHPGGKSIIQAVERAFKLNPDQTGASWETLANYGNMSSATFPFVLEKLMNQPSERSWTAGVGFGPGLSMEGILLKRLA